MFVEPASAIWARARAHGRFLADRGFDDKWVHKEERKKDIWEEVKS